MAAYRDKRRSTRPWVLDISYIDRRSGERRRYVRDAKLQTAEGARSEERMLLVTLSEKGFIPEPTDVGSGEEREEEEHELTLAEAHALFEKTMKPTLKPSTVVGYEKNLKAHLLPRFGTGGSAPSTERR